MSKNKEIQTRQIILDLLGQVVADVRKNKDAKPDLWKMFIDNACYRIDRIYEAVEQEGSV